MYGQDCMQAVLDVCAMEIPTCHYLDVNNHFNRFAIVSWLVSNYAYVPGANLKSAVSV